MRAAIPVVFLLAVLSGIFVFKSIANQQKVATAPKEIVNLFAQWKQKHGKLYGTPSEEVHRLNIFHSEKLYIDQANQDYAKALFEKDGEVLSAPMFGLNGFADLTRTEFTAKYTGAKAPEESLPEYDGSLDNEVAEQDNLQQSYDVRVRNQGSCGSCWAFSAIASFEKQYSDATRNRLDFSQQDLVDCDGASGGCNGGYISSGLSYIQRASVATSATYPYIAARGACRAVQRVGKIAFSVQNFGFSNSATVGAITRGKIVGVTLFAGGKFRYLKNEANPLQAALTGECGNTITHAVNAFMQSNGNLAILNSWGTGWGTNGWSWVKPCSENNLWGNQGSSTWAQ